MEELERSQGKDLVKLFEKRMGTGGSPFGSGKVNIPRKHKRTSGKCKICDQEDIKMLFHCFIFYEFYLQMQRQNIEISGSLSTCLQPNPGVLYK